MKQLKEMAKADLEGIDLDDSADKIAKQYIKKYEERTGKEFSKAAAGSMKTLLNKMGCEKTDEVVDAARGQAGIKMADNKKKEKKGRDEVMHQAVKKQAKKAYDAYNESYTDMMRKFAGIEKDAEFINEDEGITRSEVSAQEIEKMKKKLEKFANKVNDLMEEGVELAREVADYRTPQGAFAFKGTSKMQSAIAKLRGIYADVRGAYMRGMTKKIEKWGEK